MTTCDWLALADRVRTETDREWLDRLHLTQADLTQRRRDWLQLAGGPAGEYLDTHFVGSDFTALSSFTSEASLLGGNNMQARIPGGLLDKPNRAIRFWAWGIAGSTGTPTYIFQNRLSSTVGSSTLSGTSIGVSPTITMQSGVSTQMWEMDLLIAVKTRGQGTNNCTLNCMGWIKSPGGFASPFFYALSPSTPPTGTFTATVDGSTTLYHNLSVTCSASSASNTVTCKQLLMIVLN